MEAKYDYGDVVTFDTANGIISGIVAIIDEDGTFMDNSSVYYDILVEEANVLYKHIKEKWIIEKVGEVDPKTVWEKL